MTAVVSTGERGTLGSTDVSSLGRAAELPRALVRPLSAMAKPAQAKVARRESERKYIAG